MDGFVAFATFLVGGLIMEVTPNSYAQTADPFWNDDDGVVG